MLTTPRAQLVERLVTSPEGVLFRATFLVYEEGGKFKARLIKAVQVVTEAVADTLRIAGEAARNFVTFTVREALQSTFTALDALLYFLGSKPRAPSLLNL